MPLLIICGFPASGKTFRAQQLIDYLSKNHPEVSVTLINTEKFSIDKNKAHSTPSLEKEHFGFFRSNVEKNLSNNKNQLLIIDDLNFIKGLRYELFCLARTAKSTYAVLFCDTEKSEAKALNQHRNEKYDEETMESLLNRFERPISSNRWDSPLFSVAPEDSLPFEELCNVLFDQKKKSKDPVSTKQELKLGQDYSKMIDQVLNGLIDEIMEKVRKNAEEEKLKRVLFVRGKEKVELKAGLSATELKALKMQFLNMNKQNPLKNAEQVAGAFLYFLSSRGDL